MHKTVLTIAVLSSLLIFGLGFGAIKSVSANPSNDINVSPELTSAVSPGGTFQVTVNIANTADLFAYGFSMSWERLLIRADSVDWSGNILEGQPDGYSPAVTFFNNLGYLVASVTTIGTNPGVYGSGLLATFTFAVDAEGLTGLHLDDVELYDSTITLIPDYTTADGYFSNVASTIKTFPVILTEGTWMVPIETNTYLTGFAFSGGSKTITFTSSWGSGTSAFSNVTIPNDLLGGPYTVTVDGVDATPGSQPSNGTHSFLYITYTTSTPTIVITGTTVVPEFPTALLLPIFMATALTATALYKFRLTKRKKRSD